MKIQELLDLGEFEQVNPEVVNSQEITRAYTGDMLSWVMANAEPESIWITIQTHLNTIAVATLLDMSCIILAEGTKPEEAALNKANEEGISILTTDLNAFQVASRLAALGVK